MRATGSCPRTEDLADSLRAAPEDERREHVESCPRCRAQLAELRTFLEPGDVPHARVADAEAALAAAFDRDWRAAHPEAAAPTAPTAPATPSAPRAPRPSRPSIWEALFAPALRPAWSMAAVVVVAGGLWVALRPQDPAAVRGSAAAMVETLTPVVSDGALTLAWKPVEGADRYEVTFLDAGLFELGAPVRVTEPRLTLRGDSLVAGLASGASVMWQVSAWAGDRELVHSVAQAATLPQP